LACWGGGMGGSYCPMRAGAGGCSAVDQPRGSLAGGFGNGDLRTADLSRALGVAVRIGCAFYQSCFRMRGLIRPSAMLVGIMPKSHMRNTTCCVATSTSQSSPRGVCVAWSDYGAWLCCDTLQVSFMWAASRFEMQGGLLPVTWARQADTGLPAAWVPAWSLWRRGADDIGVSSAPLLPCGGCLEGLPRIMKPAAALMAG